MKQVLALLIFLGLVSCGNEGGSAGSDKPERGQTDEEHSAEIRIDKFGVPEIRAKSLKGVGFGLGYAFTRDHLCVLADQIVKVRSERAKFFGPGPQNSNIHTDFGYLVLETRKIAEQSLSELTPEVRDLVTGYADGYNHYLESHQSDEWPDRCRGADWVHPISVIDLLSVYLDLAMTASGARFLDQMAIAQPPGKQIKGGPLKLNLNNNDEVGSNGWALGSDLTDNGKGIVMGNPHLPLEGEKRWYESHLIVPGLLNVRGVSLYGLPLINIGFNKNVAWTHTVSKSKRFTVYILGLSEDDPTKYIYDGQEKSMSVVEHSIEVLKPKGLEKVSRTFYSSHHGPIIVQPGLLEWTDENAFALKDANQDNLRALQAWLEMNLAQNMGEFKKAFESHGTPWVNTIAADDQGNTFYIDGASVPQLSPLAEAQFRELIKSNPLFRMGWQLGVALLDGSRSIFEWQDSPNTPPGLVPLSNTPRLERKDYVANSNNSHWLTNPQQPLEGYSILFGGERTQLNHRARMCLKEIAMGAGADQKFTLNEVKQALFNNNLLLAQEFREELVSRCQRNPNVVVDGQRVNLARACQILRRWDGTADLDSVGLPIFREFAINAQNLFSIPFDPGDPLNTPRDLKPAGDQDEALIAMGRAVLELEKAEVDMGAKVSESQVYRRGDMMFPMHGGKGFEGACNIVNFSNDRPSNSTLLDRPKRPSVVNAKTDLHTGGYEVNNGPSHIMVMQFTDEGPVADVVTGYSQSDNTGSENFNDQAPLYIQKKWRRVSLETLPDTTPVEVVGLNSEQ